MISEHDKALVEEARRRDVSAVNDDLISACESDEAREQIRRIEIIKYRKDEYYSNR